MTCRVGDMVRYNDSPHFPEVVEIKDVRGAKWVTLAWAGLEWAMPEEDFLASYEVVEEEGA